MPGRTEQDWKQQPSNQRQWIPEPWELQVQQSGEPAERERPVKPQEAVHLELLETYLEAASLLLMVATTRDLQAAAAA